MGQFALGIRSLLVKAAVFVVMAALLAWALGGTLFPKPSRTRFENFTFGNAEWFLRLSVGGRVEGEVVWELMHHPRGGEPRAWGNQSFQDAAGLVVSENMLYFAAQPSAAGSTAQWRLFGINPDGEAAVQQVVSSRLAADLQLARLRAGRALLERQALEALLRPALEEDDRSADNPS